MKKHLWAMLGGMILLVGCGGDRTALEIKAERLFVAGRDLEEELDQLPQAIERYREISETYAQTATGKRAGTRHRQLVEVQKLLEQKDAASKEDLLVLYENVLTVIPDYFAVLRTLGRSYYNASVLASQLAQTIRSKDVMQQVVKTWGKQDSMWSQYAFRPIPTNRAWQDRLCEQATIVARMLGSQAFREYDKALAVITRGLEYAVGEGVIARAKVYASFYTFRQGRTEALLKGIDLAEDAIAYEFLEDDDKARAYHAMGLCYTYLHQDTGELATLDAAIKALNEAVNLKGSMEDAKILLRVLRKQRGKLAL